MRKPPIIKNNSHWALGKQWFYQGLNLFFRTFIYWLLGFLSFSVALQLLLSLGDNSQNWSMLVNALVLLFSPVITVGIVNVCHQVSQQQTAKARIQIIDLTIGFRRRLIELLSLGAVFVVLIIGVSWLEQLIVSKLPTLPEVAASSQLNTDNSPDMAAVLIKLLLSLPVFMVMVFSPQLVYFYRQTPIQALFNSIKAVLHKWQAWLVFFITVVAYLFVGVLLGQMLMNLSALLVFPLLLFILSLTAVSFCGQYYAFVDTFPLSPPSDNQSGDDDGTEIHAEM